jgi:hypothetical protein
MEFLFVPAGAAPENVASSIFCKILMQYQILAGLLNKQFN